MSSVFDRAVLLLAQREHGAHELTRKLMAKGFVEAEIEDALERCQELGLQSDQRFAESLTRTRIRQGYGPLRIRQDLQSKCVDCDLVRTQIAQEPWLDHALTVWTKKYQDVADQSFAAIQKQKKFLQYRGFPIDTINRVFK